MGLFSRQLSSGRRKRMSLGRIMLLVPLYGAAVASVCLGAILVYYSVIYPDPLTLRSQSNAPYVRILARDGSVLSERGGGDDYVPFDMLPPYVADAVIATEDQRFYDHHGVDPVGMIRAAITNLRYGRTVQGGSTLTQQLAKNLYLSHDRTWARKMEEFTLALWLEARLSKEEILELYLNRVYLGSGAYGIDAAARRYFGKSARDLSLGESAMIAGLLKAPSRYSPLSNPRFARSRARLVLSQMVEVGFITEDQERDALQEVSGSFERFQRARQASAEFAIDYVLDQLSPAIAMGMARRADLVVETTLDPRIQDSVTAVVERSLDARGAELGVSEAAALVLERDGAVLAMVGGRSYTDSQFNRAVSARRQPGSAFKPLVYLAALEAGYTPETLVDDAPLSVGGWAPRNDSGDYLGRIPLRTALARSVNTVAARLAVDVGPARVARTAQRLGIRSPLGRDATLALGTSEVTLLELAGAYNVLANAGRNSTPYIIRRVRSPRGEVLMTRPPVAAKQLVAREHVDAMNDMLAAALAGGTGRRAALPHHPAAGKTGTSQSFRDAWFVGYTAHFTAGVWAGNDDGTAMNRVVGGSLPAEIWREIMLAAHEGMPAVPLASEPPVGFVPPKSHPREAIGEDFIARALGETEATGSIGSQSSR